MQSTITANDALKLLADGKPLADVRLDERLELRRLADGDSYNHPLTITRCTLTAFDGTCCMFTQPVVLNEVVVENEASFYGSYFFAGLHIKGSAFSCALSFLAGGHNRDGAEFRLEDSRWAGFVEFFDCWFEGPVRIQGCTFEKGTDLLGNIGQPFEVQFDVRPMIENNIGQMDVSTK